MTRPKLPEPAEWPVAIPNEHALRSGDRIDVVPGPTSRPWWTDRYVLAPAPADVELGWYEPCTEDWYPPEDAPPPGSWDSLFFRYGDPTAVGVESLFADLDTSTTFIPARCPSGRWSIQLDDFGERVFFESPAGCQRVISTRSLRLLRATDPARVRLHGPTNRLAPMVLVCDPDPASTPPALPTVALVMPQRGAGQ